MVTREVLRKGYTASNILKPIDQCGNDFNDSYLSLIIKLKIAQHIINFSRIKF